MAAEPGIEPGLRAPKTPVLPLHNSARYSIIKLLNAEGRDRTDTGVAPQQFLRLSRLPIPPLRLSPISDLTKMERKRRFELPTSSLARRRSTAELLPLTHLYGAEAQTRTGDTRIFNPLLYQLSYLGAPMRCQYNSSLSPPGCQAHRAGILPYPSTTLSINRVFPKRTASEAKAGAVTASTSASVRLSATET
jgi:hypothetical protein